MEQTALRAPRTTGAPGWGARGPGQTFERARSTKVGDGLVPVRTAIPIGTEAQSLFMGLWVPESDMGDFRDAYPWGCKTHFADGSSYSTMSRGISHFLSFPKFKEELVMPFRRASSPNQSERGFGNLEGKTKLGREP